MSCGYNGGMNFGFGDVPGGMVKRKEIRESEEVNFSKEFAERLKIWRTWARNQKDPGYYVKLAEISFGYGGKHYSLKPAALHCSDECFELVAADILKEMENKLGCDYGVYIGFMD